MSQEQDDAAESARRVAEQNTKQAESAAALTAQNRELHLAIIALLGGVGKTGSAFKGTSDASINLNRIFASGAGASSDLFKSFGSLTEAEKRHRQAVEEETAARELHKKAMNDLGNSIGQFSKNLLAAGGGLSKYNGAINSAGDAAFNFGKSLGPVGFALGALVKGATMAAAAVMKQNDTMMAGKDTLADFGAAGALSAVELRNMGAAAGYTREEYQKWTKITKSLGTDMIGLSSTVNGGVKEFAELSKVTNTQYENYRMMGVSQEQLTQNQADYIKLQSQSGKIITEQMKRDGSLKAASLEYTNNLLALSAITGLSVDQAKKAQEQASSSFDIQIKTRQQQLEANELRKTGNAADLERANSIDKEIAAREKLLAAAAATGDAEVLAAAQSRLATGAWTEASKKLLLTVPGFDELAEATKKGKDVSAEFTDQLTKGVNANVKSLGTAGMFDKSMASMFGMSKELMTYTGNRTGKDVIGAKAKTDAEIAAAAAGNGPKDNVAKAVAKEETAGRTARELMDDAVLALNPFAKATTASMVAVGLLAGAAVVASIALGKMALGKGAEGVGALMDIFKKSPKSGALIPTATKVPKPGSFALPAGAMTPSGPSSALPNATRASSILDHTGRPFQVPVASPAAGGAAAAESRLAKAAASLGKLAGPLSKVAKAAGPIAAVASVGMAAHGAYTGYNAVEDDVKSGKITKAEGTVKKSEAVGEGVGAAAGGAAGGWAGAAGGAMAGAAIGSVVPILGTAIGAALGGLIGGGLGAWGGSELGGKAGKGLGTVAGGALAETPEEKAAKDKKKLDEAKKAAGLAAAQSEKVVTESDKASLFAEITDEKISKEKDSLTALEKSTSALTPFTTGLTHATVAAERLAKTFDNVVTKNVAGTERKAVIKKFKTEGRVPSQAGSIEEAKQIGAANPEMPQDVSSNMELMAAALKKQGIIDPKMIAATLGNVMKETEGKTKSENLDYRKTSNDRIRKVFGSSTKGKTDEEINEMKSSPEKMGEGVYGAKTEKGQALGNMEPGDGWKYRGRGFIQLTGKNNYAAASQAIYGDDRLVKNPDLVNNPAVAAECSAWFMKKGQAGMAKKLGIDTKTMDQSQANLLATSQIAGQDVRKMGAIGAEHSAKVDKHAASFAPGTAGGAMVASAGSKAPGVAVASADTSSKLTGRSLAQAKSNLGNPKFPSGGVTGVASGSPAGGEPADLLKFGGQSGSASSFAGLDSGLQQQVLAAAKDYKDTTGKMLQVNSAKRDSEDQKRLYDATVAAGTPGKGPSGMAVAKPGRSKHEQGNAIDIQQGKDDSDAIAAMNKQGLQQTVPGDPVHFQMPQAKGGGVFSGPKSGFPVELHGNELVAPLDPNSMIAKLLLAPSPEAIAKPADVAAAPPAVTSMDDNTSSLTVEMIEMLSEKLDKMIDHLSSSNDTQDKILQYSRS